MITRWLPGVLILMAMPAHAGEMEFPAVDHGFYQIDSDTSAFDGFHNAVNTNYIARITPNEQNRNFFVFDLSGLTDAVVGATLRIESISTSAAANLYTVFDVSTPIATLTASHFETAPGVGNAEGRDIFDDLGSGTLFGATPVSAVNALCNPNVFPGTDPACPSVIEEVELNAAAVAAINGASGLLAMGGKIDAGEAFASSGGSIGDFTITLVVQTATVVDAIDRGFYQVDSNTSAFDGFHNAVNNNYTARVTPTSENRNFFVFDLSMITEGIGSATLRIESVSTSAGGHSYTLYDVETDVNTLRTSHFETAPGQGNAAGRDIFADLGTGTSFGSTTVSAVNALCNPNVFPGTDPACPSVVEEIELNAAGVAVLNSAAGLVAIGGRISSGSAFGSSGSTNIDDFEVALVLGASVDDADNDGVPDGVDNCPADHNPAQEDLDNDGAGDVCDPDDDGDLIDDIFDNCPVNPNTGQEDDDFDGLGNACDSSFDAGNVVQHIEDVAANTVFDITMSNVPGGNGMIAKLTGADGVIQRAGNAVSAFEGGVIDAATYVALLEEALDKLHAFENQLNAKINNGKIIEPEASNLQADVEEIRETLNTLISAQ